MEMTRGRWKATHEYLESVFGTHPDDLPHGLLADLPAAAHAFGMPDISVGPVVGRLLKILASTTRGRLALEVGTLGGYSAIWIASGLAIGCHGSRGRVLTVEIEPRYAEFARGWFEKAGMADRIDVRVGAALDLLPNIASEVGERSVDLLFLDAEKKEYPEYWRIARPLVAEGGMVVIDNALGSGSWWIDDAGHPAREAANCVNQMIAGDSDFEAVGVPLRQGVLIARRMR